MQMKNAVKIRLFNKQQICKLHFHLLVPPSLWLPQL